MSEIATSRRIASLDGLRGLAVLLVVVMHYYVSAPAPASAVHETLKRVFSLSFCGVDLFFVLSGLLIGGILLDYRDSPRLLPAFFTRRFLRIVPLYGILLLSFLICRRVPGLSTVNHGFYFQSSVPTWSYFAMLQNVAMAWTRDIGSYWLGPTWSLGIEEQFYLFMPFVVRRLSRAQLAWFCAAAFVVCPALRLFALYQGENPYGAVFLLPMRAEGLLGGVLCAIAVRDERVCAWLRDHRALLTAAMIALGAVLGWLTYTNAEAGAPPITSFGYTFISMFFAGLVLWILVFPQGLAARLFSFRPLGALGVISYFVYLFHTPVWYGLHWIFFRIPPLHNHDGAGAVTLLAFAVTVVLGVISWRIFESPLLKFGRKFSYR